MKSSKSLIQIVWIMLLAVPMFAQQSVSSPQRTGTRVLKNIPYYTGQGADPKFHSLDLYLPEGHPRMPLVMFIHGGGWRAGDKSMDEIESFVDVWTRQGFALASVNYRLSPAVKHPAHIEDVARAFAWLRSNASQYGFNPENIFIAGHSAGAHLAALLALEPKYLQHEGLSRKTIRGVIAISALYNLGELYEPDISPTRVELSFPADRAVLDDASPVFHVAGAGPDTPPIMIVYSDDDMFGLSQQAKGFYAFMLQHDLPVQLVKVANRTHSGSLSGIKKQIPLKDSLGRTVLPIDDMLGPAMMHFVQTVQDGSFSQLFHVTWTQGGLTAAAKALPPAMKQMLNVQYYSGPGSDPKLNSLDLLVPEGKTNVPLLLYVHGGSWRGGDKQIPKALANLFGRLGWAVASTNYRLSPAVKHPTHVQDVARAFAYLYKNATQYGIDPNRIVILGHSAGGHLVSLLALDPRYLQQEGIPATAIKGVIATSGMYDVPRWYEPHRVPSTRSQAFGSVQAMDEASPIRHLHSQAPPFLITYTDRDAFMQPQQAHWFYSALLKQGLRARIVQVIDRSHQEYLNGVGTPVVQPSNNAEDVLGLELVEFASEVVGPDLHASVASQ